MNRNYFNQRSWWCGK